MSSRGNSYYNDDRTGSRAGSRSRSRSRSRLSFQPLSPPPPPRRTDNGAGYYAGGPGRNRAPSTYYSDDSILPGDSASQAGRRRASVYLPPEPLDGGSRTPISSERRDTDRDDRYGSLSRDSRDSRDSRNSGRGFSDFVHQFFPPPGEVRNQRSEMDWSFPGTSGTAPSEPRRYSEMDRSYPRTYTGVTSRETPGPGPSRYGGTGPSPGPSRYGSAGPSAGPSRYGSAGTSRYSDYSSTSRYSSGGTAAPSEYEYESSDNTFGDRPTPGRSSYGGRRGSGWDSRRD